MMIKLKSIAEETTESINSILVHSLTDEQAVQVADLVEKAVIRGLLEGQHRAVDAAKRCARHDEEEARRYSEAIRHENDMLIATLSSLR
ncbi:MAG: hypothetical protein HOC63_11575 [Rhodospirillales bacterium]|jgi:hypothetical protein|nr:hypothetical protein [Rhodospirillales bacterium]MBT4038777.1 hypothetical protein [Rhodospirillales bacterium]MBT4627316.1 hypothetical protein [Rhodospirillales bacterium]MBT5353142.1 hypothetical protein [Rhodospirillales bacterium]MBT5520817.1 hypothetical protein [Rhodospirillales bacterium]